MDILHISAECYPAAKAGGLGDVAGALPKYLNLIGTSTAVIIPRYHTKWLDQQSYQTIYTDHFQMGFEKITFEVQLVENDPTGFPLYVVNIPGKFDRPGVYTNENGQAFDDEQERALSFQIATLTWVCQLANKPKVIHCHDHHTGLIPFLTANAFIFEALKEIPTVFTIHNGEYHGAFSWEKKYLLPNFDESKSGLLDWNNQIVPLASAIKCAWKVTTVSPSYMDELRYKSNGLEQLLKQEAAKSQGVLNGIDTQVWDPTTDPFLSEKLTANFTTYKNASRTNLHKAFNIDKDRTIVAFIGRLVREKGAELLPEAISRFIYDGGKLGFVLLGTGDKNLHRIFDSMSHHFPGQFSAKLEYNEGLAHQIYAGADFLLMPSLVEPCGLNQMYAMRYGTIPVVRSIGGLKDTVPDIGLEKGTGIRFDYYSVDEVHHALKRIETLNEKKRASIQENNTKLDFSWERSAKTYQTIYNKLQE